MSLRFHSHFILVILAVAFGARFCLADGECPPLVARIATSQKEDWDFHHGSTLSILAGNAGILAAAESLRAAKGGASFNSDFLVNSAIDMTMTFIGQQIALVKVPEQMRSRLSVKAEFWLRSGTNTFVNFLILILAWKAAAAAKGCHIDGAEIGTAFGFCGITYTGLQVFRDFAFLRLPKRMDQKYAAELSSSTGVFAEIKSEASKKAQELGIDPAQTNELILTLLEKLIESLPFESRISDESPLSKVVEVPKTSSDRRVFIQKLLGLHRNSSDPSLISSIEDVLDLGPPFSKNESMRFHKIFSERHAKRRHLRIGAAVIDRLLGGVLAGGLLMRQLTQNVLRQ